MPGPYPVLLAVINQQVNRALGEDCQTVEINNAGSNCWVVINGKYVAGPYQQNVVNLPSPVNYVECKLTSTAAPGQTNPSNPQGIASLNFYPFQPAPGGAATPPANPGTIVGGAGWQAAADPNALVKVAAGDAFLTSQINQLVNLVTGIMRGQIVTLSADGGLQLKLHPLDGGFGSIEIDDQTGNKKLIIHSSNQLDINNSANNKTLFRIDDSAGISAVCGYGLTQDPTVLAVTLTELDTTPAGNTAVSPSASLSSLCSISNAALNSGAWLVSGQVVFHASNGNSGPVQGAIQSGRTGFTVVANQTLGGAGDQYATCAIAPQLFNSPQTLTLYGGMGTTASGSATIIKNDALFNAGFLATYLLAQRIS